MTYASQLLQEAINNETASLAALELSLTKDDAELQQSQAVVDATNDSIRYSKIKIAELQTALDQINPRV